MNSPNEHDAAAGPHPKGFGRIDYVKVTALGFGLTALWGSLNSIVLPLRLLDFVPDSQKNTYLGYLTFTGLLLAMLVQPVVGASSDRSGFSWGRRRPYVLAGAALALLFLPGIALWESYAAVFASYCLLQISTNSAQGPYQGLLPDLVPVAKRGLASGVKALLEILGGLALVRLAAYFMDRYSPGANSYWLWLTLGALGLALLSTALITLLTVKEQPGRGEPGGALLPNLLRSFKIDFRQNRSFLWFLVSRGLLSIPGVILQTFALYYLIDVVDIANPAAATADLLIAVGGGLLAVVYFAGRLSDKVGRRPVLVSSGLLGALGIVVLYFSRSYPLLMLSGAIIGMASGSFLSTSWALATDLAAEGAEAKFLGLTNLAMAAGSALARLIGPAIDFFNTLGANLGYSVMLLVCFIAFVGGSLLVLKVRPIRRPTS